jgi:hypothetical protein
MWWWQRCAPHVAAQLRHGRNVGGLVGIRVQREVLGHLPEEDLAIVGGGRDQRVVEGTPARPLALSLSLQPCIVRAYQSVSRTAAVCPRKRGIWSGARPRSLRGMTANAPPPLDSQLTAMYSGLAYGDERVILEVACAVG